jgi:hypothetical protein
MYGIMALSIWHHRHSFAMCGALELVSNIAAVSAAYGLEHTQWEVTFGEYRRLNQECLVQCCVDAKRGLSRERQQRHCSRRTDVPRELR